MDFISHYLNYTRETEPPTIFHRWCAISAIGALLGRRVFIQHGHSRIFPNLYVMLIGSPGTRKSTAIKLTKKLVTATGYEFLGANKTSKEKFLLDLEGETEDDVLNSGYKQKYDADTARNLWGDDSAFKSPKEVYVMADEFNEFAGAGNIEFYSMLGDFWDWDDENLEYKQRVKNSKSVSIFQPTVSIIGGNTAENFARAFPPDIIGQGFFSRLLLIHGERSSRKIAFPIPPSQEETDELFKRLQEFRIVSSGSLPVQVEAEQILTRIYSDWQEIDDIRFKSYSNRRFTQLLKLCIITTATSSSSSIDVESVITANTILSAAERLMSKALGEFGKSKQSDVVQKIMDLLIHAKKPMSQKEIFGYVHKDVEKPQMVMEILNGLSLAERVQYVTVGKVGGYLAKITSKKMQEYVDWSLLTEEERGDL